MSYMEVKSNAILRNCAVGRRCDGKSSRTSCLLLVDSFFDLIFSLFRGNVDRDVLELPSQLIEALIASDVWLNWKIETFYTLGNSRFTRTSQTTIYFQSMFRPHSTSAHRKNDMHIKREFCWAWAPCMMSQILAGAWESLKWHTDV